MTNNAADAPRPITTPRAARDQHGQIITVAMHAANALSEFDRYIEEGRDAKDAWACGADYIEDFLPPTLGANMNAFWRAASEIFESTPRVASAWD